MCIPTPLFYFEPTKISNLWTSSPGTLDLNPKTSRRTVLRRHCRRWPISSLPTTSLCLFSFIVSLFPSRERRGRGSERRKGSWTNRLGLHLGPLLPSDQPSDRCSVSSLLFPSGLQLYTSTYWSCQNVRARPSPRKGTRGRTFTRRSNRDVCVPWYLFDVTLVSILVQVVTVHSRRLGWWTCPPLTL